MANTAFMGLLQLLPFVVAISGALTSCPKGWINFRDQKCFLVSEKEASVLTARTACAEGHSRLASLVSSEEINFVKNFIDRHSSESIEQNLKWLWTNRESFNSLSLNVDAERDLEVDSSPASSVPKCWITATRGVNRKRQVNCLTEKFHFVCETPLYSENNQLNQSKRQKREITPCPEGWNNINARCYKIMAQASDNDDHVCSKQFNATLVPLKERGEILKLQRASTVTSGHSKGSTVGPVEVTNSANGNVECALSDSGLGGKSLPKCPIICVRDLEVTSISMNGSQILTKGKEANPQSRVFSSPALSHEQPTQFRYSTMFFLLFLCAIFTMAMATGSVIMVIRKAMREQRKRKASLQFENILFDVDSLGKTEPEYTYHDLHSLT